MGRAEDLLSRILATGEAAIDVMIAERQSEELFLDFKRSSDNGSGKRLSDIDRNNLAKAISGFGNSEGGLIVWGVDCRSNAAVGDVAAEKIRIQNPARFKSWLEGAVSGLTVPPHPGVRHYSIAGEEGSGFVVSSIPKSYLAPHQCLRPSQYYMRAGSNFEPVPHGVLAGMFGRAPQPEVFHMWTVPPVELRDGAVFFSVGILLTNRSPAIAKDVYLRVMIVPPGEPSQVGLDYPDLDNWSASHLFGCITQVLSKNGFRMAPHVMVQPIILRFVLTPPFEGGFHLEITTGCSGSPIKEFRHQISAAELQGLYGDFVAGKGATDDGRNLVRRIIGDGAEKADPLPG